MNSTLDKARELFFQGVEHFEARRLQEACKAFEASLELAPGRPSVMGNLGITLFHLGSPARSISLLEQAVASDPQYIEAWTCLALSLQSLGRLPEALNTLEKAEKQLPRQEAICLLKGRCLMQLGRAQDALNSFEQALQANPQLADAWSAKGSLLRDLQQKELAAECFAKAMELGADPELHQYYLASVSPSAQMPPEPPRQYVESLFDEYAPEFQKHVTGSLRYEGYRRLLEPLKQANRRYSRGLDLGCGTGLCAPLLHSITQEMDGVDLSQAMLEQARHLGLYRKLIHQDIGAYLQATQETADLIIAADVFIYVGKLDALFQAIRCTMLTNGCFAFTVEESENGQDVQLLPSLRYAHSEHYIRRLAFANNFHVDQIFRAPIRHEQTRPVQGLYVYLS